MLFAPRYTTQARSFSPLTAVPLFLNGNETPTSGSTVAPPT